MSIIRNVPDRYYELSQFFGGYLNQDFDVIYGGVDEAIATYCKQSTIARRTTVAAQLRALLFEFGDDAELAGWTAKLHLDVDGEVGRGISKRMWLEDVVTTLEA